MKIILACLICLVTSPVFSQWRAVKVSSTTDTNAIQENFRRASLWSGRKLDRFSNDTLYGQPIFQNGIKFLDGTIQTTAVVSTGSFATSAQLTSTASAVTALENTRVLRAGDTMTGQLTNTSSVTITGNGGQFGLQVSSNVYIVGFSSAAKYYGDGSTLTGLSGAAVGAANTFTATNTFTSQGTGATYISSAAVTSMLTTGSASFTATGTGGVSISSLTATTAVIPTITGNTSFTGTSDFGVYISSQVASVNVARAACPAGTRVIACQFVAAVGTSYALSVLPTTETTSSNSAFGTIALGSVAAYSCSFSATGNGGAAYAICARFK